jgi:hypothetical protein
MTELRQYEDAYKELAEDPNRWMSSARNLLAAADHLWVSVRADLDVEDSSADNEGNHADIAQNNAAERPFLQYAAIYLMVAGFAVENALKAVLVRHQESVRSRMNRGELRMARELQTHNLRSLAQKAGISLSDSEEDLLERLRAYLEWAGRYPVATSARGQGAVQNVWGGDQDAISGIFQKVEAAFDTGL